jgi:hypothetical protein
MGISVLDLNTGKIPEFCEKSVIQPYSCKLGKRPIVEQSVATFLKCGDLQEGFARVRWPEGKIRDTAMGLIFSWVRDFYYI